MLRGRLKYHQSWNQKLYYSEGGKGGDRKCEKGEADLMYNMVADI